MTDTLKASLSHWPELSRSIFVPHTEAEYQRLVALLDQLVDDVGNDDWSSSDKTLSEGKARRGSAGSANQSHPLASLMEVVGLLIEKYEDEQVPELEESSMVREDPPIS